MLQCCFYWQSDKQHSESRISNQNVKSISASTVTEQTCFSSPIFSTILNLGLLAMERSCNSNFATNLASFTVGARRFACTNLLPYTIKRVELQIGIKKYIYIYIADHLDF